MSSIDLVGQDRQESGGRVMSAAPVRSDLRFFANELRITFFRRRNQLLLLVAALFPLLIGSASSSPRRTAAGRGPSASGAA